MIVSIKIHTIKSVDIFYYLRNKTYKLVRDNQHEFCVKIYYMTRNQIGEALRLAKDTEKDLPSIMESGIFFGFALKGFNPVYVTIEQVASLMRYQGLCLNGVTWDEKALQEVTAHHKKFLIY